MSNILERRRKRRAVCIVFDCVCVCKIATCSSVANSAQLPFFSFLTIVQGDIAYCLPASCSSCECNGAISIVSFVSISEVSRLGSKFVCVCCTRASVTNLNPVTNVFPYFRGVGILQLHVFSCTTKGVKRLTQFIEFLHLLV